MELLQVNYSSFRACNKQLIFIYLCETFIYLFVCLFVFRQFNSPLLLSSPLACQKEEKHDIFAHLRESYDI